MICHGVVDVRKLGCNICFLYSGFCLCMYKSETGIVTWGKLAVRWVRSTNEATQPSPPSPIGS